MKPVFAQRMSRLSTESAFEVLARAKALEAQGKQVVHLEIGQPDFKTPQNIIEAAYRAMNDGFTGYTPAQGLMETREAVAEYCLKYKNVRTNAKEVVMVPGGKPIMFYTMLALINPGDEVICPNPASPYMNPASGLQAGCPCPCRFCRKTNSGWM